MSMGISHIFGTIVRKLRKEQKISQEELAKRSGLHINTIYLLERGANEPRISTFLFIAKALNTTPDELIKLFLEKYHEKELTI